MNACVWAYKILKIVELSEVGMIDLHQALGGIKTV